MEVMHCNIDAEPRAPARSDPPVVIEALGPAIEALGPAIEALGPAIEALGPAIEAPGLEARSARPPFAYPIEALAEVPKDLEP